jgi:hypothetical protein
VSFFNFFTLHSSPHQLNHCKSYTKKAEELKAVSLASAMETLEKLELKLAEFAKKHKYDIQHDPAFRSKFLEMCGPLGEYVDVPQIFCRFQ